MYLLLKGVGRVGRVDQGEKLHLRSSGFRKGPDKRAEITSKTQDIGWRTASSPVSVASMRGGGLDLFCFVLFLKVLLFMKFPKVEIKRNTALLFRIDINCLVEFHVFSARRVKLTLLYCFCRTLSSKESRF